MKLTDMKIQDRPQKVLVYGAPKTGKSLLVGKLAEYGYKLYWFDGDNGIDVLFQLSEEARNNIEVYPIRDLGDKQEFAKLSNEFAAYRDFSVCETHGAVNCIPCKAQKLPRSEFKWEEVNSNPKAVIVFDSLSQLVSSVQNYIARNDSFDDFGSVNKESKREWGHYMAQNLVLSKFFSMVQNAMCKIVCISHETELDAEKNPSMKLTIPTGGTSTQSKSVSKYFGHIVHCRIKTNMHGIVSGTMSDPNAVAGSRLNVDVASSSRGLAALFEVVGNTVAALPATASTVETSATTSAQATNTSTSSQLDALKARIKK